MLEKAARVDFRALGNLSVDWISPRFLREGTELTAADMKDRELYFGMKEIENLVQDELVDNQHLPIDLVFECQDGAEVLGILPIYQEDKVISTLLRTCIHFQQRS